MNDSIYRSRPWAMRGASIQIDPLFPYYADRSPDSIADELMLAGYRTVHYFVVNEQKVDQWLVEALQKREIAVWALVLGNGTFSVEHAPPSWASWKMELLRPINDGFERFSHFSADYIQWKKEVLSYLLENVPFDGVEVAEPYFPEWNGIARGVYGDVGPLARQAFRERYGENIPEFVDESASNYYKRVPDIYKAWTDLRVDAVNHLIDELINGERGARQVRPDIRVATWSLAVREADAVAKLREWQGLDPLSMIERVRPDMHVLQTHWPDWMKRGLGVDYIREYESVAAPIRERHPDLPLGIQADIGSKASMIKGRRWVDDFEHQAYALGYQTWTAYEYHIGGYMYAEPPLPSSGLLLDEDEVMITYNKRIDPDSVGSVLLYPSTGLSKPRECKVSHSAVDGNRLFLRFTRPLPAAPFQLEIRDIRDTPDLWLLKGRKANRTPRKTRVTVIRQS
ncbi:hypothetical protein [Paenibacillus wulumuqiensis]|uniref:hypothetical protein n=1 Tax=Paenibacillus wulumuqiensis TaxID=1567107 RepID=UPI00061930D6|nr:hypothetical protein [Paenibacillus wulumuqiensis]